MACIAEPQAKTETAPCMLRRANAVSTIHWNTSNAAIPQLIKPFEMENRIKSEAGTSRSPSVQRGQLQKRIGRQPAGSKACDNKDHRQNREAPDRRGRNAPGFSEREHEALDRAEQKEADE